MLPAIQVRHAGAAPVLLRPGAEWNQCPAPSHTCHVTHIPNVTHIPTYLTSHVHQAKYRHEVPSPAETLVTESAPHVACFGKCILQDSRFWGTSKSGHIRVVQGTPQTSHRTRWVRCSKGRDSRALVAAMYTKNMARLALVLNAASSLTTCAKCRRPSPGKRGHRMFAQLVGWRLEGAGKSFHRRIGGEGGSQPVLSIAVTAPLRQHI